MNLKLVRTIFLYQILLFLFLQSGIALAQQDPTKVSSDIGTVNTTPISTNNRIGPGDFLPISVKLVNFGSLARVDVTVTYQILDSNNKEVYAQSETVAVETTASFVKHIQLPYNMAAGTYTAISSLNYPYQEQPAVSKFTFTVEPKVFGIFQSDLIFYGVVALVIVLLILLALFAISKWNRKHSIVLYDYSDKPKEQMIYYEILSDIISQMRLRIGNDALEIAKNIPDLEINDKTGQIINIKQDPAKIIALLIFRFEKISGKRLSFGLRS